MFNVSSLPPPCETAHTGSITFFRGETDTRYYSSIIVLYIVLYYYYTYLWKLPCPLLPFSIEEGESAEQWEGVEAQRKTEGHHQWTAHQQKFPNSSNVSKFRKNKYSIPNFHFFFFFRRRTKRAEAFHNERYSIIRCHIYGIYIIMLIFLQRLVFLHIYTSWQWLELTHKQWYIYIYMIYVYILQCKEKGGAKRVWCGDRRPAHAHKTDPFTSNHRRSSNNPKPRRTTTHSYLTSFWL